MKVYVATSWENRHLVNEVVAVLPGSFELSYDWTGHTFDDDPADVCTRDFKGVSDADFVLVLLPGGYGTHVELGIALGLGKRVIIVGETMMPDYKWPLVPFYCHPHVTVVRTIDEAMAKMSARR